ncbi:hypothetical protein RhiirA5_429393 [Rhizophagus irregularis]|uniref:Uncharacterized protein n=1 Tax=Rhizophagus irregularis TaxID=588596 RepID=A0A2I1FP90_9GLOM|nr:hypothetical protein RhiirA5_429393 [Rhizophagus irregularis]PKY36196.1 hypothetical protein RhiirB3_458294 [Rhizophagus irregularis]
MNWMILRAAKAKLLLVTVGNTYTSKKPKDLESLTQSYQFLSKVAKSIRLLHKTFALYSSQFKSKWSSYFIRLNNLLSTYSRTFSVPIILPPSLYEGRTDDFVDLLSKLENMTLLLRACFCLKKKNFKFHPFKSRLMLGMITSPMIFPLLLSLLYQELDVIYSYCS